MKRTKQWWARLNKYERAQLVLLELRQNQSSAMGGGGYLPDDCSECTACGNPHINYGGLCKDCEQQLDWLIEQADNIGDDYEQKRT